MRKAILAVLLCFSMLTALSTTAFAATNLGTLSYWYSDSDTIGRWDESSVKVYKDKLNSNASFYFSAGMTHACGQWDDVTGMTLTSSSSSSYTSAPIKFHGGTMDEVNAYGEFTVTSSHNGVTQRTSSVEGTWTYGSSSKTGRLVVGAVGCIIDKDRTTDQYKKTCTHELGHALGWAGHSSNTSDIMYSAGSSVTSLTSRDKNHLSQVYD